MFKGRSDHIVLACINIPSTRNFYESVVGLKATTVLEDYVTYQVGAFYLCFKHVDGISNPGSSVKHIGIDFPRQSDVDVYFSKIISSGYSSPPKEIIGGIGKGPYRFYVKDPNGYTFEFESWENSSDPL